MIDNTKYQPHEDSLSMFSEEETVILDKGYCNESIVTIVEIYGNHFCKVADAEGNEWDTMIYRLSKP